MTEGLVVDGHVGIGTTGPGVMGASGTYTALQVHGNTVSTDPALVLSTTQTDNGGIGFISFGSTGLSATDKRIAVISVEKMDSATTNPLGDLVFSTANGAAPAERIRITSTGNVGIGTASPGGLLVIAAPNSVNPGITGTDGGQNVYFLGDSGSSSDLGVLRLYDEGVEDIRLVVSGDSY